MTGGTLTGNLYVENTEPEIHLVDTNNENDFYVANSNGTFLVYDTDEDTARLSISSSGNISLNGNVGIGTESPVAKLHVAGDAAINNTTLGVRSNSTSYGGNTAGLSLNSVAEIRSPQASLFPALTFHYENLATRHILMNSSGTINVVSPSTENSGVAVLAVNGNTVWHAGNLTNNNQLSNGSGYLTAIPNAGTTTVGGIKTRLSGTTLFITDNGNNP